MLGRVPFILSLLDSISGETFLPSHWRSSAKAHLTGTEYLLSKMVHSERYQYQAIKNQHSSVLITSELLAGEGVYNDTQYVTAHIVLRLMNKSLLWFDRPWHTLSDSGKRQRNFLKLDNGLMNHMEMFVSHLLPASVI